MLHVIEFFFARQVESERKHSVSEKQVEKVCREVGMEAPCEEEVSWRSLGVSGSSHTFGLFSLSIANTTLHLYPGPCPLRPQDEN